MLNWKQDLTNLDRTKFTAQVNYQGLVDKKGRTPGHVFSISRFHHQTKYTCWASATRDEIRVNGGGTALTYFDTVDQVMDYLESITIKLEKRTRANKKQFTQAP